MAKHITVKCPECKKELELELKEGQYHGTCSNCDLDVGAVQTKRRYNKAVKTMDEDEDVERGSTGKKPKKGLLDF